MLTSNLKICFSENFWKIPEVRTVSFALGFWKLLPIDKQFIPRRKFRAHFSIRDAEETAVDHPTAVLKLRQELDFVRTEFKRGRRRRWRHTQSNLRE